MTYGLLCRQEAGDKPFARCWWLHAPWAHPLWHSYLVSLADLTTPTARPPKLMAPEVTHELLVCALNPSVPKETWPPQLLQPINHGYQFRAEDDRAAEARIVSVMEAISAKRLNPDTDARSSWDTLFEDGHTLHVNTIMATAPKVKH
ncbi:hypothetical protein [Pelagibacterium montanilacus]|uniref:hypothetical protein n=1 Tax=Pelagibacterium montanilacus TaxID=2185280 RepID=UPI000F8C8A1C|nr:hypothetical protein [Pelagibacterium montanilacus]